ncbi:MAG TPA: putative RNA uridine N3 methyltransferase [Conexivisphaerales archaeon]|nr:putative RNA uridine N3 methyltransferase [Conexivisphaerales archaeon]
MSAERSGKWVALPSSLLMEDRDLRDKTVKLGMVARAIGIFGVEKVIIYRDPVEQTVDDSSLIEEILRYIETPQYLRRKLYPLKPRLSFAGLLPPLRIPSHKPNVGMSGLVDGEFREAVVEMSKGVVSADVGVEAPLPFEGTAKIGSRVTVVVHRSGRELSCEQVESDAVRGYWGFEVKRQRDLEDLLEDGRIGVVIGTSRKGEPLAKVWNELSASLQTQEKKLVVFGAPKRGLFEMFPKELIAAKFDFMVNTIPDQKTETVRTEEALLATLAVLGVAEQNL